MQEAEKENIAARAGGPGPGAGAGPGPGVKPGAGAGAGAGAGPGPGPGLGGGGTRTGRGTGRGEGEYCGPRLGSKGGAQGCPPGPAGGASPRRSAPLDGPAVADRQHPCRDAERWDGIIASAWAGKLGCSQHQCSTQVGFRYFHQRNYGFSNVWNGGRDTNP